MRAEKAAVTVVLCLVLLGLLSGCGNTLQEYVDCRNGTSLSYQTDKMPVNERIMYCDELYHQRYAGKYLKTEGIMQ